MLSISVLLPNRCLTCNNKKTYTHAKGKTPSEETKQASESGSATAEMLALLDRKFRDFIFGGA